MLLRGLRRVRFTLRRALLLAADRAGGTAQRTRNRTQAVATFQTPLHPHLLFRTQSNPVEDGHTIWLFAGSEWAGQRAAAIMSLLATAKANVHDPHAWLTEVLTRLPTTLDRDLGTLLPTSWQPAA